MKRFPVKCPCLTHGGTANPFSGNKDDHFRLSVTPVKCVNCQSDWRNMALSPAAGCVLDSAANPSMRSQVVNVEVFKCRQQVRLITHGSITDPIVTGRLTPSVQSAS